MSQFTQEQKLEAFEHYLCSESPAKISKAVSLPVDLIRGWINNDNWRAIKEEIDEEARLQLVDKYRTFLINNRVSVAEKHLALANELAERIREKYMPDKDGIKPYLKIRDLSSLSKALKDVTDIAAKAVGLHQQGASGDPLTEPRKTLIVVGAMPRPIEKKAEVPALPVPKPRVDPF